MTTTFVWTRRFATIDEVPIVRNPVVPHDHPDLTLIHQAYLNRGLSFGVDFGTSFNRRKSDGYR